MNFPKGLIRVAAGAGLLLALIPPSRSFANLLQFFGYGDVGTSGWNHGGRDVLL
jgi:hypothetical protein